MLRPRILILIAVGLLLGGSADAGTVYVSNPDEDAIWALDSTGGPAQLPVVVHYEPGSDYEDLVVGPDNLLYACDPTNQKIIRISQGGGSPELVYQGSGGDPAFQCGWFKHTGDFLVSDTAGTGVWSCPGLAGVIFSPGSTIPLCHSGSLVPVLGGFAGQGLTQAANGTLLAVDSGNEKVVALGMDQFLADFYTTASDLITGLDEPIGIARASGGDIFVATDDGVLRYDPLGASLGGCDNGLGNRDQPYFLDFTTDDVLYVATTSNNRAKLWQIDIATCDATMIREFRKPGYEPTLVGVATPLSGRDGKLVTSFLPTQFFNFFDHAYEFDSEPVGCDVAVTAIETQPGDLQTLIDNLVSGRPVVYLGENGRANVYDVSAVAGCNEPGMIYRHAINAYTGYVPNPRMVRCESLSDYTTCSLLTLTSYFPFNGFFPDDGRIRTKADEFSFYFLIDVDLEETVDVGDGVFCGLTSPATNPPGYDYTDPDLLDDPAFRAMLPVVTSGETVPLKFRVAAITAYDPDTGDPIFNCDAGPFLDQAIIMFSTARLYDPDGVELDPFEPYPVQSAGGSGLTDPAIFGNPANPNQYYHYNTKYTGYPAGYYQLVIVPLTNNFPAVIRYLNVVP